MTKLLDRPDLQKAAQNYAAACRASRQHSELAREALAKYGDHGPDISGCVRDHFPLEIKDELRRLAREVTRRSAMAEMERPPRVRKETMRRLAREIARRDGAGFYGPQP